MPPKVRQLPRARADRIDLWLYIAADSIGAADRTTDRIDEAIDRLADYPELGPERSQLGAGIRILPVDNLVIIYRLTPDWLTVIRILHAARDIGPDLLAE